MSRVIRENSENSVEEIISDLEGINLNQSHSNTLTTDQKALQMLQKLQNEHRKIEEKFEQEWLELKASYEALYKPLYKSRADILSRTSSDSITSIPNFWLTVFSNSYTMKAMIEEEDYAILEYLMDVRSEWLDEKKQESFILYFVFAPNPYFTNEVLTKQYNLEKAPLESDPVFSSTESTIIDWKENQDVTKKYTNKKKKNKKTSEIKVVKEPVENKYSFFSFFSNIKVPNTEDLNSMRRSEVEDLRHDLEFEYGAGVTIRDRIIPYAVKWFQDEMESDESDDEWSASETYSENDDDSVDSFVE